ncbi:Protein tincar [Sarcoptes scabiei]|uniref:Protein tincar n=1 Tax=Sarcoptes scabiei TaxID=52283 RepID=A0A834VBK0_SARSC|nr:Protein tincar [Sarcoptes scabiei]
MSRFSIFKQFWQTYSLNNLATLWYSALTTCLQIYLIIQAINRFSAYISLPWSGGSAPIDSINFYMLFIASSILILPFFIIVSMMKVGNYANDGLKLGSFNINKCLKYLNEDDHLDRNKSWSKIVWKHFLPIGPVLHLLMALCLLFPNLITDAQLIRHGFLNRSDIWKTDLDFILKRFNGRIFTFFNMIQTINQTEHRGLFSDIFSLSSQILSRNNRHHSSLIFNLNQSGHFSLEYINLIIALLMITARYPSVFWRINKSFAIMLTTQLVLNSLQSLIVFNAFEVAFKIFVCDPTHLLIRFRESSSLNLVQISILILFYLIVLQLSSISFYVYGLHKYREFRYARTKYFQSKYENDSFFFINLLPYIFAFIFFLMLAISIGPLFYEFAIIYSGSLSFSAFLMLSSTIGHFMFWILLWIVLAWKTQWSFDYEDVESSNDSFGDDESKTMKQCSILITNQGKIFKIKDDIATMTIINFIQSNGFEKINQNYKQSSFSMTKKSDESKRKSAFSLRSPHSHQTLSKSFRYSKRRTIDAAEKRINIEQTEQTKIPQLSDSDDEYATFYRVKRTYSLKQKNKPKSNVHNEIAYQHQNRCNSSLKRESANQMSSRNVAYGLTFLESNLPSISGINHHLNQDGSHQDRISDSISSGFHSNGSHCSLVDENDDVDKNNTTGSLESLMEKIEKANVGRPNIRSLNSLQKTSEMISEQMEPKLMSTFLNQNKTNQNQQHFPR